MKNIFITILAIISISCQNKVQFEDVSCIENGQSNRVFKPCRQIIYNAKLWDAEFNLISESKIWMMATGRPWEYDPDKQTELIIQYEYDLKDVKRINKENINKSLEHEWVYETTTGVWEDDKFIGMHPFRQNQYTLTEIAPFPDVALPLEIGKKWHGNFNIGNGWGDWENSKMKKYYEVISFESIDLPYDQLNAWHVNSFSEAPSGNSTHNFWFHPDLGFVKMIITNYAGQTLQIELIDVIEI